MSILASVGILSYDKNYLNYLIFLLKHYFVTVVILPVKPGINSNGVLFVFGGFVRSVVVVVVVVVVDLVVVVVIRFFVIIFIFIVDRVDVFAVVAIVRFPGM